MPRSFAKLDYVVALTRTDGVRTGAGAARRFLVEWLVRQLVRLDIPAITWGRNVRITGKLVIRGTGQVVIGDSCVFDGASGQSNTVAVISPTAEVLIGSGTYLNGAVLVCTERIVVGENCILGQCSISDNDFHPLDPDARLRGEAGTSAAVTIGDGVWIGTNVVVLKGVKVGDRSVVGAGTVVHKDVPADSVVVGEGQRVVREFPH